MTVLKSSVRIALRMSSPVIGTTRISSRLPRSISFVMVSAKPFQETRKPTVARPLRFSSLLRNRTNSFLPHFPVQFLHSAKIRAPSRRSLGSSLSFRTETSISSVAVRTRPVTEKPGIVSNNRLVSSSSDRPLSSVDAALATASTSVSRFSEPHPDSLAAISAI